MGLKEEANRHNNSSIKINMNDSLINNVTQLREFLKGSQRFDFSLKKIFNLKKSIYSSMKPLIDLNI